MRWTSSQPLAPACTINGAHCARGGFRLEDGGSRIGVWGSGFEVWRLRFGRNHWSRLHLHRPWRTLRTRENYLGFGVCGLGFVVLGLGFWVLGVGFGI